MSEFILIIIWVGAMTLLANVRSFEHTELVCGEEVQRFHLWFAFAVFLPVIWMAGHRDDIGDTWAYVQEFLAMPDSFSAIASYAETRPKDTGFYVFSAVVKQLVGNHPVRCFETVPKIV